MTTNEKIKFENSVFYAWETKKVSFKFIINGMICQVKIVMEPTSIYFIKSVTEFV